MHLITNISDTRFSLNGTEYLKNYVSAVAGDKVEVYNCYERKDVLVCLTHYSQFRVNGASYNSAAALQQALLGVTYLRSTLGEGSFFDQNNTGRVINAGTITLSPGANMKAAVAAKLNTMSFVISAKETPVLVLAILKTGSYTSEKHRYIFKKGRGTYGSGGTPVTLSALELISIENYTADDVEEDDTAVKNQLSNVANGNFVSKANQEQWDFSDSGTVLANGLKSYYFKYTANGVTHFAKFTGTPGIYGNGGTPLTEAHFDGIAKSDTTPVVIPTLDQVARSGNAITDTAVSFTATGQSRLELMGTGLDHVSETSGHRTQLRFADPLANTKATIPAKAANFTLAGTDDINGLTLTANQAAAEIYLKNAAGTTIATLNVGFLNNEGTTFVFNGTTEKLELRNDAGTLLSEVPVSAFVSNMVHAAAFNPSQPSVLEFKDGNGETVFSATYTIANITGLQAALDALAVPDASPAAKGRIMLAGDLAGTAAMPVVGKLTGIAAADQTIVAGVLPDGTLQGQEIMELFVYDDTVSGYASLSALAIAYPTASGYRKGFEVRCRNTTPRCVYRKDSDGDEAWTRFEGATMT